MVENRAADREVLTEVQGSVLVITLNRPEAKNAATAAMAEQMAEIIDDFEANDELFVAVITGAGQTFCSGMDLKAFVRGERPSIPGRGFLALTQRPPTKPVIAAVEGYALAGGFETMLACDLVVASEAAKFGIPEVKRGLAAAAGGLLELPKRTHRAVAMEMALTGDIYEAEFGYRHGFVNRLTAAGEALEEAIKLANAIAANGPLAVKASKRIITESPGWSEDEKFDKQAEITGPVFASEDAKEGATAFAEKRAPQWAGR
ncbi:crotonase/enoyl-CoA hydratase family protein [Enteractinococcus fodinae]|uniref:Enoyl-CoA hydratase n=1 Tax=Enteractinococcus fodinae TaxID=684663 RepID=A0ABU2B3Q9_9MICC|nr:crotonase/enoyl-CoA hydratase family protein [Enteractinococcus fodinae]MDR7348232.1 enoyl-CoA hydratase [Enteractinococcus fodinae]